jgi:hypothetical protein
VERRNYLGIYLSKETATVVCLGPQGGEHNVLSCFSVSIEKQEEQTQQALARLIAEGCAERGLQFSEVAVALDCAMFMQHNVHSEFEEPKQIAATIRFDTEEAFSTEISDVAIAFKISSSDRTGSELTVFTAQRKILSDVLTSLQSNNIDPISIEPDINCLSRFVLQNISLPEDLKSLFGMLSRRRGYFITFEKSQKQSASRTFLVDPAQDRGDLLTREALVMSALAGAAEPINCLKVFDSKNSVNWQQLSERLGIEVNSVDLAASGGASPDILADCADSADFAIAYGAALAHLEKVTSVNFRNDFMPYQGKKVRLQKTLKFLSVSVTVLMLAVGLYFQLQLLGKNKYRTQLWRKFEKQYSAVMFDKKPPGKSGAVSKLGAELRRIQDVKSGQLSVTGEESISAKLTLVLEAFNKCAAQTDLSIDSVSITTKTISIVGDTSSRKNTLKLFEAIKGKLDILQQRLDSKGGRDNFWITVVPRK